jgi:sulfhydrogenase subunit beta (sulfur reductase)
VDPTAIIDRAGLDDMIGVLREQGFTTVGPTIREGAIVWDEIGETSDLPVGWTDRQQPGAYALEPRDDDRLFGFVVGPGSLKRWFHPERSVVWRGVVDGATWREEPPPPTPRYAFIGVRACELAAVAVQDRVLADHEHGVDPGYAARRSEALLIAVNCDEPGALCFCSSMGTGPEATSGYDLVLTEVAAGGTIGYLVEVGSARGRAVVDALGDLDEPDAAVVADAAAALAAAEAMPHELDTTDIHDLLLGNLDHPHWEDVADRCLTCTNCTLVCPTCFCSSVTEGSSLDGRAATRTRSWDSCFTLDFSYIHGGSVRTSPASRYRQWLTHKLATWIDQFGTSGCVGCGRCITWCPVGIDLTAEVAAIRRADTRPPSGEPRIEEVTV